MKYFCELSKVSANLFCLFVVWGWCSSAVHYLWCFVQYYLVHESIVSRPPVCQ